MKLLCWSLSGSLGVPPPPMAWPHRTQLENPRSQHDFLMTQVGVPPSCVVKSAGWLVVPLFPKIWQLNMWNTNLTALRENKNSGYAMMEQSTAVEFLVLCFIHSIIRLSLLDWAFLATVQYMRPRSCAWSTCEPIPVPLSAKWNPSIFQGLVQM